MKVGTDGVLLGAWANIAHCDNILDIGCGSGLISIMAAQRSKAHITGVEIDPEAAAQAVENVNNSLWSDRIEIINSDITTYNSAKKFDAIVSNPPFFSNSLKCAVSKRSTARHDETLPCDKIMKFVADNLTSDGIFSVIIPCDFLQKWRDEALFKGLSTSRITEVRTVAHKQAKRVLVEFTKKVCNNAKADTLILKNESGEYSIESKELLKDFYINI